MIVRSARSVAYVFLLCLFLFPVSAAAQAALSVSRTSFTLSANVGSNIPSQTITISNNGNRSLKWTVGTPSQPWLTVSPTSGVNSGTLTLTFNMAGYCGVQSATFNVNSNAGSVPVTATVTMNGICSTSPPPQTQPPPPPGTTLMALAIVGPGSVTVGQTTQYTAKATYSDGSSKTLTTGPSWWILDSTATITQAGAVTAVSAGTATIHAYHVDNGVTRTADTYTVNVAAASTPPPSGTTLMALAIVGPGSVTVGQTTQYTAKATYSDGSSKTLTSGPSWWILDSTATITTAGAVTAMSAGTATIHAYYVDNGVTRTADTYTVNVAAASTPAPPPPSGSAIYVSTSGLDTNAGSQSSPVRTIQRGVDLANALNVAGSDATVSVAPGVYREAVNLGSPNTTKAFTLMGSGATADAVVLTGADDWSAGWTPRGDGSYVRQWIYRWGTKPIPSGWESYWNWDGNGYKRNTLLRSEMVYINGSPLKIVLSLGEVSGAGTYYVDESGGNIYMRPPSGVSLPGPLVEVGMRLTPLAVNGRHNVTLKNFAVMRNRGAVQQSAVQVANSRDLTFDGFQVRWASYAGLSTAYVTNLQILNSLFADNGVNGLDGYRNTTVLLQDTEVSRNNWRGWSAEHKGFDTVHKWSETHGMTVRRGNFVDNYGHGLWFDGDNQGVVIDGAFSARNRMRGAYFELNVGPIAIQNSVLCENGFEGVANARSNNLTLTYNQIFNNKYWQITATGSPTPVSIVNWQTGQSSQVDGSNWTITHNIVKGQPLAGGDPSTNECYPGPCGWAFWAPDDNIYSYVASTLTSDYNQWYHSSATKSFRVPSAKGTAVDFPTFKALMSNSKANDAHSSWGDPGSLSCSAPR